MVRYLHNNLSWLPGQGKESEAFSASNDITQQSHMYTIHYSMLGGCSQLRQRNPSALYGHPDYRRAYRSCESLYRACIRPDVEVLVGLPALGRHAIMRGVGMPLPGCVIGSTTDFGSVCPGSSPGPAAIFRSLLSQLLLSELAEQQCTPFQQRLRNVCYSLGRVQPNRPAFFLWAIVYVPDHSLEVLRNQLSDTVVCTSAGC
jgi:hypothetical protein